MEIVLTQWGSWFDSWGERRPKCSLHKLLRLYLAHQLGWSLKSFIGKSGVLPEHMKDGEHMSMSAQAKQMVMAFRGDSSGVLHTALLVDLGRVIKRKADMFW